MSRSDDAWGVFFGIVALLVIGVAVIGMRSCAQNDGEALEAVVDAGYTAPRITDVSLVPEFSGCSKSDSVAYQVAATNVAGKPVHLVVCKGLWKAYTVRIKR